MADQKLVVAAVLVDDLASPRSVLAARRTTPHALAGRWEFPGGKVNSGEDPVLALRRELMEELQIEVTMGDELIGPDGGLWPISDAYAMRTWFAQVSTGTPSAMDSHDEIAWVASSQLRTLRWVDADTAIVKALMAWFGQLQP